MMDPSDEELEDFAEETVQRERLDINNDPTKKTYLHDKYDFPLEVFGTDFADNLLALSKKESIPVQYLGLVALYTVAALAGNMYESVFSKTNVVFAMMLGRSGSGKTPAFKYLFGDILTPLAKDYESDYKKQLSDWKKKESEFKANNKGQDYHIAKPTKKKRLITEGTKEALTKYAETTTAGYGVKYDEGATMLSINSYNTDPSRYTFWNEAFNGELLDVIRVDDEKERFIPKVSISVLAGMQTELIDEFFTKESNKTGFTNRWLIAGSKGMVINRDPFFNNVNFKILPRWKNLVETLFNKGVNYSDVSIPFHIPFTESAKLPYEAYRLKLIDESNDNIEKSKVGTPEDRMNRYESKLYKYYFNRFLNILAIYANPTGPVITEGTIEYAEKLINYFKLQAINLFNTTGGATVQSSLSDKQLKVKNALPEAFNSAEAAKICTKVGEQPHFFKLNFPRVYKDIYFEKIGRGEYRKL